MRMLATVAGAAIVLGILAVGMYFLMQTQLTPVVTQEEYDQIEEGMAYAEVVKIIGEEGNPTADMAHYVLLTAAESRADFLSHKNYAWANPDGSGIVLSFDKKHKLIDLNVPGLDTPGIMHLNGMLDRDGHVTNEAQWKKVLGNDAEACIKLYEIAMREELPEDDTKAGKKAGAKDKEDTAE